MNKEIDANIALMEQLLARVELSRRKGPREVAKFASELEGEFEERLAKMKKERDAQQELALASDHKAAA